MQKESLEFGSGNFVGPIMREPAFFDLPVDEQARIVGWAHGCPVVNELISPESGRGPEAMVNRYGQVNFWSGYINSEAERLNPALGRQLKSPVPRLYGEQVGKQETKSVPVMNFIEMSPMGTLTGYALPRILIEQLGINDPNMTQEEVKQRLTTGLDTLEEILPVAQNPLELLALAAEALAQADADPERVLSHVLAAGWLEEHNAHTMVEAFKEELADKSPSLWSTYTQLSPEKKAELALA